MKKKNVTICLSEQAIKNLRKLAEEEKRSMSQMVEVLISKMSSNLKSLVVAVMILFSTSLSAQIPVDKQYHAAAGAVAGVWGTFAGNSLNLSPEKSLLFGVGSATIAGIGKETWDVIDKKLYGIGSGWDFSDLGATVVGGVIGAGVGFPAGFGDWYRS